IGPPFPESGQGLTTAWRAVTSSRGRSAWSLDPTSPPPSSAKSPESRSDGGTSCWLRDSSCRTNGVPASRSSSLISSRALARTAAATTRKHVARDDGEQPDEDRHE